MTLKDPAIDHIGPTREPRRSPVLRPTWQDPLLVLDRQDRGEGGAESSIGTTEREEPVERLAGGDRTPPPLPHFPLYRRVFRQPQAQPPDDRGLADFGANGGHACPTSESLCHSGQPRFLPFGSAQVSGFFSRESPAV